MDQNATTLTCTCCIAGGGPAGMMLGYLFARAGVDTIVLEKHADFLRDFRGDTIHPSTLEVMHDLGLFDEFLKLPHETAQLLSGTIGDTTIPLADFSHLPTHAKFIAFMPQWDFLDFLASHGKLLPSFRLMMHSAAESLIEENGHTVGIQATTSEGAIEIRAALTVGADGRHSTLRDAAGFVPLDIGAPIDVLWFRVTRQSGDPHDAFGRLEAGHMLILINRGDQWQCGYVIAKGSFGTLQTEDISLFRARIAALAPFLTDRLPEIATWTDVKLLTVAVDRLPVWHKPGLLLIGDAAHAMSPVGGVGINLAIQDAVAAANLLVASLLRTKSAPDALLAAVQARREMAVRLTQAAQVFIQNKVISGVLGSKEKLRPPWIAQLFIFFPLLRRLPARLIGLGVRPERITAPELKPGPATSGE